MRHSKPRRNGRDTPPPPFIDPAFAEALAGERDGRARRHEKVDYKALQLCRQVQRALSIEFGGIADDVLRDATVVNVTPAPDATHLLVHVALPRDVSVVDALSHLDAALPRLRAEVARAITRKRAPMLSFVPVASPEVMP